MIRHGKVLLRPVTKEDLNAKYVAWLNDQQVNQYLETRFFPQSHETVTEYWQRIAEDPSSRWFAICDAAEGVHIGNIRLGEINWIHRRAELSIFVGNQGYWGKGYAHDAIQCLTDWALRTLGLSKITAWIYAANQASQRAFEKCGYCVEGRISGFVVLNGERHDVLVLGISS